MEQEGQKTEELKLPCLYRWLLKIPLPEYFDWLGRLPLFVGLLVHGLMFFLMFLVLLMPVPIMVFTYLIVGFPLNVLLGMIIPAILFVFFARVELEKAYNFWKSINSQPAQRDVSEVVNEYMKLLQSQQKKTSEANAS